jgi:hypothetical protein
MRGSRALAVVRAAATAAIATLGLSGAAAAPADVAAVAPVPFATGHIVAAGHMAQPPTTAECEADFGIACYQPFQLQRAYDLAPLFSRGIEGQGETIVIVDAFGSPSIASDLQAFDAQEGLPNPPSFRVITPRARSLPTRPTARPYTARPALICAPTTTAGPTRRASMWNGRT